MKEFTISSNDAGQRLDRFLAKAVPLLPASLAQKYIRIKRIKLNGARADRDTRLNAGDVLQLYINDEFFDKPREDNAYLTVATPKLSIVYEDENILLVDKRPGLAVHPHDGAEYGRTLIDHIQAYLYQKREWSPRGENSFTPALCNRIDRNTNSFLLPCQICNPDKPVDLSFSVFGALHLKALRHLIFYIVSWSILNFHVPASIAH